MLPSYLLAVFLDPGYLQRQFDFVWLIDTFLDKGLHLDNLCVYDRVIKSETSFHCQICNRCVEMFDHHCPFINNCLGYRNYKFFLIFLTAYSLFLLTLTAEFFRHVTEIAILTDSMPLDYLWCAGLICLVLINLPFVGFQVSAQCKQICRKNDSGRCCNGKQILLHKRQTQQDLLDYLFEETQGRQTSDHSSKNSQSRQLETDSTLFFSQQPSKKGTGDA